MKKKIALLLMVMGLTSISPNVSFSSQLQEPTQWTSGFSPGDIKVEDGWTFVGAGGGMYIKKYKTLKCCVESNSNSACDFKSKKLSSGCSKDQNIK